MRSLNKRLIPAVCLSVLLAGAAYGQKMVPGEYNGTVRYESTPVAGTLSLIATGFGKNTLKSSADAVTGAFYMLLFKGIPGSPYELPMIPDENEKRNDPAVRALLNGGYSSFLSEDLLQNEEVKVKKTDGLKGKMTTHKVTINCDALRRYLEQNNVIRKFGI
jgi:hypothetical protein